MAQVDGTTLPNPAVPKTLGILNVIFAVVLTALGLCGAGFILLLPQIQQFGQQQAAQVKAAEDKEQAAELKTLDDRAAAATNDADKATIARERDDLLKRPAPVVIGADMAGIPTDPRLINFVIVQSVWGLILDVVLLVSGIGLIRLRNWGRKSCLAWAALSIVTALGVATYGQISGLGRAANQAQVVKFREAAAKPNATPADQASLRFAEMMDQFTIVIVIGTVLAQITYPIICLILLNSVRARAACLPRTLPYESESMGGFTLPPRS